MRAVANLWTPLAHAWYQTGVRVVVMDWEGILWPTGSVECSLEALRLLVAFLLVGLPVHIYSPVKSSEALRDLLIAALGEETEELWQYLGFVGRRTGTYWPNAPREAAVLWLSSHPERIRTVRQRGGRGQFVENDYIGVAIQG